PCPSVATHRRTPSPQTGNPRRIHPWGWTLHAAGCTPCAPGSTPIRRDLGIDRRRGVTGSDTSQIQALTTLGERRVRIALDRIDYRKACRPERPAADGVPDRAAAH